MKSVKHMQNTKACLRKKRKKTMMFSTQKSENWKIKTRTITSLTFVAKNDYNSFLFSAWFETTLPVELIQKNTDFEKKNRFGSDFWFLEKYESVSDPILVAKSFS